MKTMEVKWKITIREKKRGLWRPPIEIRIWLEGDKENPLNIRESYEFPYVKDKEFDEMIKRCRYNCSNSTIEGRAKKGENAIISPFSFFDTEKHRENTWTFNVCRCLDRGILCGQLPPIKNIFEGYGVILCPEWRPGVPDYTDVYEWLRDTLVQPCVDEFNRRIAEAEASPETEEVVYTSDDLKIQRAVEETKKVSRRLKVA